MDPDEGMLAGEGFWGVLERLAAPGRVVIDRPKGSRHPRYPELVYPLDYGYLEGTRAMDGGGIDVWVGSQPERGIAALALTVDLKKGDVEIKILLGCTAAEQQQILEFQNGGWMAAALVRRGAEDPLWLLRARRSVRRFRPDPVPGEALAQLVEAAAWAPSAHNRQPWRFAVITRAEAKASLADALGAEFRRDLLAGGLEAAEAEAQVRRSRQRITQAPAAVLACLDGEAGDAYPDPLRQGLEAHMGAQGVAMAGENLLLAAQALGLGAVWICAPLFAPQAARQALDLPESWLPQGLALIGYPAALSERRPRRPLAEIARFY